MKFWFRDTKSLTSNQTQDQNELSPRNAAVERITCYGILLIHWSYAMCQNNIYQRVIVVAPSFY